MTAIEFRKKLKELFKKCPKDVNAICIISDEKSDDITQFIRGRTDNLKGMTAGVLSQDDLFRQIVLDAVWTVFVNKKNEE